MLGELKQVGGSGGGGGGGREFEGWEEGAILPYPVVWKELP